MYYTRPIRLSWLFGTLPMGLRCRAQPWILGVLVTAIVVTLPRLATGQQFPLTGYSFSSWSLQGGLPSPEVWGIAQSTDGRLWVATAVGLVQFDGHQFALQPTRSKILTADDRVFGICAARDGSIWAGFRDGGISRVLNGKVTTYQLESERGAVSRIAEDPQDGSLWAGSTRGLYRFDGATWGKLEALAGPVWGLFFDRSDNLWVAASQGVFRTDSGRTQFTLVDATSSPLRAEFVEDAEGRIAMTNSSGRFRTVFPRDATSRAESARIAGLAWGGHFDSLGNLWVGTRGAGVALVRGDGRVDYALPDHVVTSVLEDRDGSIWVGTLNGLHRFSSHILHPIRLPEVTFAVAADHEGRTWLATMDGVKTFGADLSLKSAKGLENTMVNSVLVDRTGGVWAATLNTVFRLENGRFQSVIADRRFSRITGLGSSSNGTLWISDALAGVFSWEHGLLRYYDGPVLAVAGGSTALLVDRQDRVWVAFETGRIGLLKAEGTFRDVELDAQPRIGVVETFFEAADGDIWIGGRRGFGVFRGNQLLRVGAANGFLWGGVHGIVQAGDGALWLSTTEGLVRIAVGDLNRLLENGVGPVPFFLFTVESGMAGPPAARPGAPDSTRDADGRLWFTTSHGVTVVDPDTLASPSESRTSAVIQRVVADGAVYSDLERLRLSAGTNHIDIPYAALQLRSSAAVRFVTKLEGIDKEWIDAGTSRQASYASLAPGRYEFQVAAVGLGEPSITALEFFVAPKLYQTPWFSVGCVALTLGIAWLVRRNHLSQLRRQSSLVLRERTRISQELHDTLLQSLAGVAMQLESLPHDGRATEAVRYLRRRIEDDIREARETIMELRTATFRTSVNGDEFVEKLRQIAERTIVGSSMDLTITAKDVTAAIDAAIARQVFRATQEALSNAVRHSGGSHLTVGVEQQDGVLSLIVRDDGCGFQVSSEESARVGYGQVIMRERIEQVGGKFSVTSERAHGTVVTIKVPMVSRRRAKGIAAA